MNAFDRIVILGWGSLLWEGGSEFDAWHEPWQFDGPTLKMEFSRISRTRKGALTLVIDPTHGSAIIVAYCMSRRPNIDQAIGDLRKRERTNKQNIGYLLKSRGARYRDEESFNAISTWAENKHLDGVVWTDLPSNFAEKIGKPFSTTIALEHLTKLSTEAKELANEYLKNAPNFVITPLRAAWNGQNSLDKDH